MSFRIRNVRNRSNKVMTNAYKHKDANNAAKFKPLRITAETCGELYTTVERIYPKGKKSADDRNLPRPSFISPPETYKRAKYATESDEFDGEIVRRTVHEFYDRGEYPTPENILSAVKQKFGYVGSSASLKALLKSLKFSRKRCNDGRKILIEANDVVALRNTFLQTVCTSRENNDSRTIIYLDETFVNENHSKNEGFKAPARNGDGLIVCYAGSSSGGYVPNSKLVFQSKSRNCHSNRSQMNSEMFKSWFVRMMRNLDKPSIIVMDNAPYHCALIDKLPKKNARKADIQEWLCKNNIEFSPLETVAQLHARIKLYIPTGKKYEVDELALKMGHRVIRLPPYHYQYNPIGLIWALVKNEVAARNTTFEITDVERLVNDALDSITENDWRICVRYTEDIQNEDYEKALSRNAILEPIILRIIPDEDSRSEYDYEVE